MPEIGLDGIWQFQPDPFGEGEALGYPAPDHDASHWREVAVPTVFDRCGPGMHGYEGAGWFRRSVTIPAEWQGKHVTMNCGAVNYTAHVWVNGTEVARSEDGFLPFEANVTPVLRFGGENIIVVRADNTRREGEVPGKQRGWRPFGGILRPVSLAAKEPVHFRYVNVATDIGVGRNAGIYRIMITIGNTTDVPVDVTCSIVIADNDGNVVEASEDQQKIESGVLAAGWDGETGIENVVPWSPENPFLYCLRATLCVGGKAVDRAEVRFGFRKIAVGEGRIELNGQPILLLGFNRHEDAIRSDMCADPEAARQDLLRMKQMGANFVRLCHYPHDPRTLDLCDEIGLLAMCEIPLYWWSNRDEDHAAKLEAAKRQLTRLIERDDNHPSVIFWSVSNETSEAVPEVAAGNAELVLLAKQLDPTRLATHVSDKWTGEAYFEADDVICVNSYPTWGAHAWQHNPQYDPAEGATWWRESLAKLHARYPNKPIVVAEFGYPAVEGVTDGSIGEAFQAKTIEAELGGILSAGPYVSGATIWCWADHPWAEDNWINYLTTSPFGVVARDRYSKPAALLVERLFKAAKGSPSLFLRRPNLDGLPKLELPGGYTLRVATDEDAEQLGAVLKAAFPEMDSWSVEGARKHLLNDETVKTTFVIEKEGQIVATASARLMPDAYPGSGYIHWVGADPEHRGKRIGYLASLATLHEFVRLGCKDAVLETDDFRLPAIKVYFKLGFVPEYRHATHAPRWAKLAPQLGDKPT